MRLHLSIHRSRLPVCHILYATNSGPAPHTSSSASTIADLLADVNELVPLESADGEWGLEDYVVQVVPKTYTSAASISPEHALAVTQHIRNGYECLHYQEIEKVLREDDEIMIHGMSTEELREKRIGGRFQISGDGRHLVDGVGFGRRWLRAGGRPGVRIPGRKRRKLLEAPPDNGEDLNPYALDDGEHAMVKDIVNDLHARRVLREVSTERGNEEDDDDSSFQEDTGSDEPLRIMDRPESDIEDAQSDDSLLDEDDMPEDELDLSDELDALLEDAQDEIEEAKAELQAFGKVEQPTTPRPSKRKRDAEDDGEKVQNESIFEGFSTPMVLTRAVFEDADINDSTSESGLSNCSGSEADNTIPVADAADDQPLKKSANRMVIASEDESTSSSSSDGSGDDSNETDTDTDSLLDAVATARALKKQLNVFSEEDASATSSSYVGSSSNTNDEVDTSADSMLDAAAKSQASKKHRNPLPEDENDSGSSSSCDTSDSESTDDSESDSSDARGVLISSPDSESSSTSDSDSELDTHSSESSSDDEAPLSEKECLPAPTKQALSKATTISTIAPVAAAIVAPGEGSSRTRAGNNRTKRRQRLLLLKERGLLPKDANFAALYVYDQQIAHAEAESMEAKSGMLDGSVEEKKRELLEKLGSETHHPPSDGTTLDQPVSDKMPASSIGVVRQDTEANKEDIDTNVPPAEEDREASKENLDVVMAETGSRPCTTHSATTSVPRSEPPKRRSKLDLASSRRMLFSSLGLKTPKTPAAEQALRENLAQSVRTVSVKAVEVTAAGEQSVDTSDNDGRWQDKVRLSAVECLQEGIVMLPPPFPFEQRWDKNALQKMNKKKARKSEQICQDYSGDVYAQEPNEQQFAPDISMLGREQAGGESPTVQSKTLSAESADIDDMPRPDDFGVLDPLQSRQAVPGAVIAYRSWEIRADGPELSAYHVARILDAAADGYFTLLLSKPDRDAAVRAKYDQVTGERKVSRFEFPEIGEEEESGERVVQLADLVDPKMVETPKLQVAASLDAKAPAEGNPEDAQAIGETAVIPDSGGRIDPVADEQLDGDGGLHETHVTEFEVSTPRRKEIATIIADAGFRSALDDQLVHAASDNVGGCRQSSVQVASSRQGSRTSSHQASVDPADTTNTALASTSGFQSPQFNDWSSGPPRGPEDDDMMDSGFGDQWQSSQRSKSATPKTSARLTETVAYPRVSQLDIGESSIISNVNSSSHQDAQRVPEPEVTETDVSRLVDEPDVPNAGAHVYDEEEDHDPLDSLQSVIPQSQEDARQPELPAQNGSLPMMDSFLGGHDGQDSLGDDDDPDYEDDSDLPSSRAITSSQVRRTKNASGDMRVSPPATKRGLRNGKKRKSPSPASSLPESSKAIQIQPRIKISASQEPRLSQIPPGTQIVDLTFSSDPVSPSGSDGEYGILRRRRSGRTRDINGTGKRSGQGSQKVRQLGPLLSEESGLGRKTLLVSRKTKSQI